MTKNSIEIDLNDPRSAMIADVMSSKTAKKILNFLAESEKSASDIASELEMPLNTVTYNLDKLVSAGLVEKAKRFFWSSKGKKMDFYKVANKRIVISPRTMSRAVVPIAVFAVIGIVLALILMQGNYENKVLSDDGPKTFGSIEEMKLFLENTENNNY